MKEIQTKIKDGCEIHKKLLSKVKKRFYKVNTSKTICEKIDQVSSEYKDKATEFQTKKVMISETSEFDEYFKKVKLSEDTEMLKIEPPMEKRITIKDISNNSIPNHKFAEERIEEGSTDTIDVNDVFTK